MSLWRAAPDPGLLFMSLMEGGGAERKHTTGLIQNKPGIVWVILSLGGRRGRDSRVYVCRIEEFKMHVENTFSGRWLF